ncbi:MAG: PAS domain-containing protein [Lentisphaerae bacterium]|nr:PAS domain-containing protein [Lentisphaerota bacterium]
MFLATAVLLLTAALNLILGVCIFVYNPDRPQNRQFALFSANMGIWALCILLGATRHSPEYAAFWIRTSSSVCGLLPLTLFLLCRSIRDPLFTIRRALRQHVLLVIGSLFAALVAFTPGFLKGATLPPPSAASGLAFPEPAYGPLVLPYYLFFLVAFAWIMFSFIRDMIRSTGVQRVELQYVLMGWLLTMFFSLSTNIFLPLLTGSAQTQPFGPLGLLAMNLVISYGIATRRIMDAAGALRRVVAYGLLTGYLVLVFFLTHSAIAQIVPAQSALQPLTASLLAGVIIALSMAPAQTYMRRVADWLFSSSRQAQLTNAVESLTASLQTVSTMPELLGSFMDTIGRLTGTQRVMILLARKRNFEQVFPLPTETSPAVLLPDASAIPRFLGNNTRPIVADELLRERQSADVMALRAAMQQNQAALAFGLTARNRLIGVLLLGARSSGRIYSNEDQHNLQVVCKHLGVAIENAQLYTESIQHRLHSITLLNNLVNGVVAADADGEISMINSEAQRICRLASPEGQSLALGDLPGPVAEALRRTLQLGVGERDVDADITVPDGPPVPVRLGTSPLHDADGRIMGALAVLSDQTTVRRLESQIRRTDRLASVGTLAAGMAHEIKNPLVTINTFAQLLPDRYQDPDFRGTFTELVSHEVQRMNSLVNQLLRFARPAPALLAPIDLEAVLDHSLLLMEQQFQNNRIGLEKLYEMRGAPIRADANQLEQAFVNLLLNALQAMPPEGRLTVRLRKGARPIEPARGWRPAHAETVEVIFQDTGCGIAPEHLNNIFDPFFTTRSEGTGLGLSVAHGIITENSGTVEVASEVGVGTTFTIAFPLIPEEPSA